MRSGKKVVCLFTAALLAAAVFWSVKESEWDGTVSLSVVVSSDSGSEEIRCWGNETGEYYIFLPSYAELSQVEIHTNTRKKVYLDDQMLKDGMTCDNFQRNVRYDLTYTAGEGVHHFPFTFVQSANVPAMYISVASGSMAYIHAQKGNEEPGTLRLYTAGGELDCYGNLDFIKGRGNSTWFQEKKPYSLKLSAEADLLGMGKAQKWILLANAEDPSQLRNKIVFDYADAAGLAYSPSSTWVDLYLNGEYAGVYLLSERNEIHPQRVAIDADSGFLVSMELDWRMEEQGYPFIYTNNGSALRIHHSALDDDALAYVWESAESAILAEDGVDPISGRQWTELIDLDSWAKKYLIEEIFGSVDAGAVSQFFYGDQKAGKIFAGPVWDYDKTIGNIVEWQLQSPCAFFANRPILRTGMDRPWFYALYQKEAFYNRVVELYQTTFRPLLEDFLDGTLQDYASRIAQTVEADKLRWPGQPPADADYMQAYLTERIAFLDSVWLEKESYCYVLVDAGGGNNTAEYAVRPGEYMPELPDHFGSYGWYTMDTDEPFDVTQPIYEDVRIYRKEFPAENESVEEPAPAGTERDLPFYFRIFFIGCFAVLFLTSFAVTVSYERTSPPGEEWPCSPPMKDRSRAERKGNQEDERTGSKISP